MKIRFAPLILVLAATQATFAATTPIIPKADRIRLAEVFRLGDTIGNRLWKDWDKAPFAVLLVTPDWEFLVRNPRPSDDFTAIGYDRLLKSDVYYRKRVFQTGLLATFPAVGGISTIVVGQAENTASKTSTPWVVTLLHEHFHQLQTSQPAYYPGTEALHLSRGDKGGMWMLNYAFPYESADLIRQVAEMGDLLKQALEANNADFTTKIADYLTARRQLKGMLSEDDYKYLCFQLWQEGIARYTEYHVARLAAATYKPSRMFRTLGDYSTFRAVMNSARKRILDELAGLSLSRSKREVFYPLGAGEGLLLDRIHPRWREKYFKDRFSLDSYFGAANNAENTPTGQSGEPPTAEIV